MSIPDSGLAECSTIHVACAADAFYGPYAGIALSSVLESNSGCNFHIHLFSDGVKPRDISRLEQVAIKFNGKLSTYNVRERLDAYPALRDHAHAHYTRAAYIRFFIPNLVPPEVEWIVYLDCDIICVSSWCNIWKRRHEIAVIGGVIDEWVNRDIEYKKAIGLPANRTYYGSGVLLINVSAWRQRYMLERLLKFLQDRGETRYPDQDAINCLIGDEISELPAAWNTLNSSPYRMDLSQDMIKAVNIHYSSSLKPWHLGYRFLRGTGAQAFMAAKARSPWRWMLPDFQLRRIKRKLQNILAGR